MGDKEARAALASAYRAAPRQPPVSKKGGGEKRGVARRRADADEEIPWDGEIGRHKVETAGTADPDYVADVPAPSGDPAADLRAWLGALFQPDDKVNYVVSAFKDEDGRWKPRGLGVTRTRADIEADLAKYEAKGRTGEDLLRHVLGDWSAEAGVWARINPMDGGGATNANVVRLDHALVEGDEQEIGRQIAVIRSLRLPCSAVVHSGGKSVHAVVRIGAGADKAVYAERVGLLFKALEDAGFQPDVKCRNSSRLSRMPGPTRAGKPQYLVSAACGAESWDAWMAEREESRFQSLAMTPADLNLIPPDDNLVGERFLCRQGSWLLVAQSGVGKSVFAIQSAISFAIGREVFGLKVAGPLRNLIIQAENNAGDMHEAFTGICSGLNLCPGELEALDRNFRAVHCSRYTGDQFAQFVAYLCRAHRPDIVWIDPLLSYLGGEISKMQDTSRFLQNQLQPVLEDHNIGLVVVHHTGKPPKSDEAKYKGHDLAYLGIGSSVLTNWARATSTLLRIDDEPNRFALEHAKRSDRAGCPRRVEIKHATSGICWLPTESATSERTHGGRPKGGKSPYDGMGIELMPPLSGPLPPKYDPSEAPAVQWIMERLEANGCPKTAKQAAVLMRQSLKGKFVDFDDKTRQWKGIMYDPDFT